MATLSSACNPNICYLWVAFLLGCSNGPGQMVPLAKRLSNEAVLSESGIGILAVASQDCELRSTSKLSLSHKVVAGTLFVGVALRAYPTDNYGTTTWKLIGVEVGTESSERYILGNCSWKNGSIMDYNHLTPVPANLLPGMVIDKGVKFKGVNEDALLEAAQSGEWVVRFHAIRALINLKCMSPRFRQIIDNYTEERVDLIATMMQSGRYQLFPDVRPPFERDRIYQPRF